MDKKIDFKFHLDLRTENSFLSSNSNILSIDFSYEYHLLLK